MAMGKKSPDFVHMACVTASVCYREMLTPEELVDALLSGNVPARRKAHFFKLLDEGPAALLKGLVEQVGARAEPSEVSGNLVKIARELGLESGRCAWREIA